MKTFENIKTFKTFIQKIDEDMEFSKTPKIKRPRREKVITIPDWGIY